jgi:hypothetical protein
MGRKARLKRERNVPSGQAPWTPFVEETEVGVDGERIPVMYTGFQKMFVNSRYTVLWRNFDVEQWQFTGGVHLSIRRNDREPVHDWRDLQRIKNELVGKEVEALELYPKDSRLVDAANQFHLWCFPGVNFPFGFSERDVRGPDESPFLNTKQRPFTK